MSPLTTSSWVLYLGLPTLRSFEVLFENLGVVTRLGISGIGKAYLQFCFGHYRVSDLIMIGQVASEWWAWELVALAASL